MDMDGVLVHEEHAIPGGGRVHPGAAGADGMPFLVLTNNSHLHPARPAGPAARSGIDVPRESIWTSALATAQFLADQRPGGRRTSSARPG